MLEAKFEEVQKHGKKLLETQDDLKAQKKLSEHFQHLWEEKVKHMNVDLNEKYIQVRFNNDYYKKEIKRYKEEEKRSDSKIRKLNKEKDELKKTLERCATINETSEKDGKQIEELTAELQKLNAKVKQAEAKMQSKESEKLQFQTLYEEKCDELERILGLKKLIEARFLLMKTLRRKNSRRVAKRKKCTKKSKKRDY